MWLAGGVTVPELVQLVDTHAVNLWIVAAPGAGTVVRDLALAFGWELDEVCDCPC